MATRNNAAREPDYVDDVSRRLAVELRRRVDELQGQGRGPHELGTPDDLVERMMGVIPEPSPWRTKLGPCYTTTAIARVLGDVSRQAIDERRRRGSILALRTRDRIWVYPAWQLDARNRVLAGLSQVLSCFDLETVDHWTLAAFLSSPQAALGGRSIAEHLKAREELEPALALARDTAARWAARRSATRQQSSLAEPPSLERLAKFPVWHVHAGTVVHRVTGHAHGPWWFSSEGRGRFDLVPPRGTCYFADDAVVALLETLGATTVVTPDWLAERRLWEVPVPKQCDAADTTVRQARGFGVTPELATITPYGLPQRWAAAFAAAKLGGVRYRSRHDPGNGRLLALFGAAGERTSWRKGRRQPIDDALLARLEQQAGIVVAEVPESRDLDLLDRS